MSSSKASRDSESVIDEACEWAIRLDAGEVTGDVHTQFLRWLNDNEANREALEEVQGTWRQCDEAQRLRHDHANPRAVERWLQRQSRPLRPGLLAAAAMLGVLALGIWLIESPPVHESEYVTAVGEQQTITLPDESRLTLNTDTRIAVHYTRNERRVELLQGQAHFEVVPASDRPFVVVAGASAVRAVGTAFAVYLVGNAMEVTVTEGTVEVLPPAALAQQTRSLPSPKEHSSSGQLLTERQKLRSTGDVIEAVDSVTPDQIARELAWRDGMLDFDNAPLADVIAEARRYTQDELIILDPELESQTFTVYCRAGDVTVLMNLLESFGFIEARRVDHNTVHFALTGPLPQ